MILVDQLIRTSVIEVKAVHESGSVDLSRKTLVETKNDKDHSILTYQFTDTFNPHQKISAKRVTSALAAVNPVTMYVIVRSPGKVMGISLKYNVNMLNFGKYSPTSKMKFSTNLTCWMLY